MDLNLMKRVLSLLLALVLLIGNVPAVAFATEEIAEETVAETSAPTEAVTEPVMETSASTEAATEEPVQETVVPTAPVQETVAPTEPATEPVTEETSAPTLPAVPEETVAPAEPAEGEAISVPVKTEYRFSVSDLDLPTDEELYTAYAEHVLYGTQIATFGTAAGERLTGDEKLLYDAMVPLIKQIASGERASTVIGVGQTVTSGGVTYEPDSEVTFTGAPLDQEAMTRVFDALLSDLPYEMYWFDKTAAGEGFAFTMDGVFVYGQQSLPVAGNYRGADTYTVDTAKTGAAAAAAGNAENIVAKYAASSDYEKLVGYRDEICALVSYNFDALNMDFNEDNDPWQLIYVFDEDESTNVVCEGYSKAFMYLCDKTNFAGDVACYTVSGQMNGGNHMWNVVTIEGSNYLVDVTNSDAGMTGQNGGLFLAGGTGNASSTYNVMNIYYAYNIRTKNFWGTGADSILTLSAEDYDSGVGNIVASGTCGANLTWKLDANGTMTISGSGAMEDCSLKSQPWTEYREMIKSVVIEDGVTSIGTNAFRLCSNLTSVAIPETITSIGNSAFSSCNSLVRAKIPDSVTSIEDGVFAYCHDLTSIEIPNGVTSIGEMAFWECSNLTSVEIPETVTSIERYAFRYCGSLTSIEIPDSVTSIGEASFGHCSSLTTVKISNNVTSLETAVFSSCSSLTSVTIPKGVTSMDDEAFINCSSLRSVEIPYTVTKIGGYAFAGCSSLTSIVLPDSLPRIYANTFSDCSSLVSVEIPDSVTGIGYHAFANCSSLESITIPYRVTSIDDEAFYNCSNLTSITIPARVASIGESAFSSCSSLKKITFEGDAPEFVVWEDANNAFSGVTAFAYYPAGNPTWTADKMQNYGGTITWTPVGGAGEIIIANGTCGENVTWMLDDKGVLTISGTGDMAIDVVPWRDYREFITAVVIQEGVTSIDDDAFYRCSSLTSIEIPDSVTSIGNSAFNNCSSLTNIAIPDGVTSIGDYAFKGCESLRNITLPDDVTHIGKCAFYYCSNLAGINLPDGVTYIGGGAFFSCRSLTSVDIPDSVTSIGSGTFAQCSSLTSIVIPDSVTCIDDHAFYLCGTLQTITIGSGVSSIGEGAFAECANLEGIWVSEENPSYYSDACGALYNKNMTELMQVPARHSGVYAIPAGVTSIADEAFVWCEKLTDVIIPDGVTSIGRFAFWECRALTNVNIPDSVSTIEYGAFNECSSLESIVIPDSVTEIGDYAFDWCSNLKHVTIGSGITAIGEGVFSLCYNLTSIRIPDSVTSIDVNAFRNSATPTDIYYGGSQAQWSAVTNRPVAEYVHYSCEDLSRHWRTVTVDPTYTAGGYSYEYCSCGYERNNVITGNALGLPKPVVQAISDSVTGGATLRWEHDGEADRYEVYRATSKSGKYTRLVSVPSSTVMVNVSPGKTYYYKVKAICDANSKLSSGYSNVVKVTGKCAQPEITAAVHASSGKPMITWGKIGGAKKYEVYRATEENGTYTKVKTTTSTTYTDTSATVGTTYFYKVKAIASKSAHNSIDSAAKSCRTLCAQPVVTLKINADTGKPAFSWKAVSGAVQYEIFRAESADGTFMRLAALSDLWFEDGTAAPDKDYWYKVNALNAEGADSADGTAKKIHATLAKPMVTFAVDEVSGKPVLTWEAVEGAVQYKIYRSTSAKKSYKAIATVTDTEYVATSASVGKGYYYKVIAIGETAKSDYSSYKKLTAKCAQPVITVEASETSGKPVIKWSKVSGAKKYYVYRVDETGARTSIGSTTKTTFTDSKAVLGTTYTYQVRANGSKSAYNSIFSAVESCLTILGKPVVTAKNDAATGKVILSWKAIPGATAYEVYRTGDDGILCQMCTQSALTYMDTGEGTDVDTVYTYKVRAITGEPALDSADSNEVKTSAACAKPVASIALNGKKPMVTWESVEGATKYYVYRSTKKSSGYKKVATVEEDTYTDTKAKKGTTYYYKVVAVSENATSAQSAYVKIKSK